MRAFILSTSFLLVMLLASPIAFGQFKENEKADAKGPSLGQEITQRFKFGVSIKATGGAVFKSVATLPVPAEWPEQSVEVVEEDISPSVKGLNYRTITGGGGLRQMVVEVPQLANGQEAHAYVTFEVKRRFLIPPKETAGYSIPKKVDRTNTLNVGPSPFIEAKHPKIMGASKEAVADKETDWAKVEGIYDWAREHVKYTSGQKVKGAVRALLDKESYTDDLTSLFIAMCRAQKIPARTVFVRGHCFAEFYLEDEEGEGHWFPCQPAGERAFGGINDFSPILQKGDNFKNPEDTKEKLRYVKEFFHGAGRGGQPQVTFINEPVVLQ